jgi:hypothetical protein
VPELFELFDEYASAYARGERPQACEYLARAGPQADELARLIDEFLQRSPAAEPDEETVTIVGALIDGHPPLLELRVQRGLRRDQVVAALIRMLGLNVKKEAKVADYYHQLEGGLLEPHGVDRRVWDALAETLKTRVDDLVAWSPRPAEGAAAYLRASGAPPAMAVPQSLMGVAHERDEIDELFLFGANK